MAIPQIVGAEPEDLLRIRAPAEKRALGVMVTGWHPKSPRGALHSGRSRLQWIVQGREKCIALALPPGKIL